MGPDDQTGTAAAERGGTTGATGSATLPPPPTSWPPEASQAPPGWQPAGSWAPPSAWGSAPPARPTRTRPPRTPDPAPVQLLALALTAGIALEVGLRGGPANAIVAIGIGLVVVLLVTNGRLRQRAARATALLALLPAASLVLRASPWLAASNLIVIIGLLATAIAFGRSGSPLDATPGQLLARLAGAAPHAAAGPSALAPLVPEVSATQARRLGRSALGAAIALPVLAVVVALLAAADPVFAGLLSPDLDAGPSLSHILLAGLLTVVVLVVVGGAAADPGDPAPRGRFGVLETVTMLGLTALVLATFVVAQLVALTGAGERLVEQAGLTPAEYARTGFFQLCWATALILALVAATRALAAPDMVRAPIVRLLAAVVPALALGLVAVSLRRLALYDQAFGLTMLRLWVAGAAVWMGIVLVCLALRNAGLGARRSWVLGAAGLAALALVFTATAADPEAFVVRHNLARAEQGAPLDLDYLRTLSDDAAPALATAALDDPAQRAVLGCEAPEPEGVRTLNVAVARATDARSEACAESSGP